MFIIALEGLDKSGKATQSQLLAERLNAEGYSAMKSEHHRYDQPTGELVMKWLTNKWLVDQRTIELIMTADKQAQQKWYQELDESGYDFLILDRYILSQIVYALASGMEEGYTEQLQKYLRPSDLDIIIDIPAEMSLGRKGKHNNGENDKYEADLEMMERVRQNYFQKGNPQTKVFIDGTFSPERIHKDIYRIVKDRFIYLKG